MNRLPHRASMAIVLLIIGGLLATIAGPPPLVIRVPWLAIYAVLVALLVLGGPALRDYFERQERDD